MEPRLSAVRARDAQVAVQERGPQSLLTLPKDIKANDKEGIWFYSENHEQIFENADAAIFLTEWEEYKKINWEMVSQKMRKPSWIFDARSILDSENIKKSGLNLWRIGDGTNSIN